MVGIGAMLAAIGGPIVMQASRRMILSQGRKHIEEPAAAGDDGGSDGGKTVPPAMNRTADLSHSTATATRTVTTPPAPSTPVMIPPDIPVQEAIKLMGESGLPVEMNDSRFANPMASPSIEDMSKGRAFAARRMRFRSNDTVSTSGLSRNPSPFRLDPEEEKAEDVDKPPRSAYFQNELQFIMTIVEISDRLRSVPKAARQNSLVAELTLLNHNLPAKVCIPLWCSAGSTPGGKHHMVVRIPPNDAVTLNSADRVPYLILVEVVDEDDEMPEPLKTPEDATPRGRDRLLASLDNNDSSLTDSVQSLSVEVTATPTPSATASNVSLAPSSTLSPSPSVSTSLRQLSEDTARPSLIRPRAQITAATPEPNGAPAPIDDYSERMRTAAVMLAQLYQQQQRELIALSSPAMASSTTPAQNTLPSGASASSVRAAMAAASANLLSGSGGSGMETPPSLAASIDAASSSAPGSPVVVRDRRKYQKLRSDFEAIRNKLVKEMETLEERRLKA
ncbi:Phosphatidylinositol 4-kinase pik1alpha (PI4-kinase)(PtdIns-4-kinase), partial [Irineochytrium annulatum]